MNRVIKFRAWDKINKRISDGFDIRELFQYSDNWLGGRIYFHPYEFMPQYHCELMQFTGLQDKAGKDIYEGDIVEEEVETEYGKDKIKHDVTYNEGAFYPVCMQPSETFEVIGNVYENQHPELLTPNKT